jgi:hypothetical protein
VTAALRTVRQRSAADTENGSMRNIVNPVDLPDRRTYDAVLETQEILRERLAGREGTGARIGTEEIRAAIKQASHEAGANPLLVGTCIAGRQKQMARREGDVDEAAVGDRPLTMADVDRGVAAARRELHRDAVSQNELNAGALAVVAAMDRLPVPRSAEGTGAPLRDHVQRGASHVFGLDESDTDTGRVAERRVAHSIEVSKRVTNFFRAVARPHLRHGEEPWSKYLDQNFTIADKDERQSQVRQWVLRPAMRLIERRITEIDAIIAETTVTRLGALQERLSAFATRARLGASGPGPRTL